ncbi:GNAT family N-acetyltransferase [Paenibacillus lentus]|uniref:GNAT family N-acetyltransferase n=1 Tax=Paenibacillus lentus TaxID=1338368 RepID=A0A3S8RPP8_9BACL|nr:GNAT family N-acetyltransferase [Paenibacillus lentus]AZK45005.1 GNAT family N-acetyltransferase [Paenibacillus lentus]
MEQEQVRVVREVPDAGDYAVLRKQAGLSPRSEQGIKIGLSNSLFAVSLYAGNEGKELVGMGRVVGDGGCFLQIVDIAVRPDYQGQGLGKLIMDELMNDLKNEAPDEAYVSLIADRPADKLYLKYGFRYTAPESLGMYLRIKKKR